MRYTGKRITRVVGSLLLLLLSTGVRDTLAEESSRAGPALAPEPVELLPYQASGYRYQILEPETLPPAGFEQPGFDDSAFLTGTAAFGSRSDACPLQATVQTFWPQNTQLILRRVVSIPPRATDIRVMVSIDNDVLGIFFNGTPISGPVIHEQCSILDEFQFDVPQALVEPGDNLIVFHLLDRGVESFFDARILADAGMVVAIDVKPGGFPNPINPASQGVIPVAILTTGTFDAATIDPLTVRFGADGAVEAHGKGHMADVDQDGDLDLLLHFKTQVTGIECGDITVSITGATLIGQAFEGSDSILTTGCR